MSTTDLDLLAAANPISREEADDWAVSGSGGRTSEQIQARIENETGWLGPSPKIHRFRPVTMVAAAALLVTLAVVLPLALLDGPRDGASPDGVRVVGGDLELTMQAGGEPASMGQGLGALAEPGTVEVVAWVETDLGRVEVTTFKGRFESGVPNSRCVAVREPEGASSSCRQTPAAPFDRIGIRGLSFACEYATGGAYGGIEAIEAVFTTRSGKTVSVLTVRGLAYGIWPSVWGPAQTVTFFDAEGAAGFTAEFHGVAQTLGEPPCD